MREPRRPPGRCDPCPLQPPLKWKCSRHGGPGARSGVSAEAAIQSQSGKKNTHFSLSLPIWRVEKVDFKGAFGK